MRKEEHQNAVKKQQSTSSVGRHVRATIHIIDLDSTQIITDIGQEKQL